MTSPSIVTLDELIGLVAGTLSREDFLRIAQAVKEDATLQAQLAGLEGIRDKLSHATTADKCQVTAEALAEQLIKRIESSNIKPPKIKTVTSWITSVTDFLVGSSKPARLAYGLVAIQAVGIAWLLSGALQNYDEFATDTRTVETEKKQIGGARSTVTFSVNFDPATPESDIRALLLELEAQFVAGPTQLARYTIIVARNRSHLALVKLREATFIEQVTEIAKEPDKPSTKDGENK